LFGRLKPFCQFEFISQFGLIGFKLGLLVLKSLLLLEKFLVSDVDSVPFVGPLSRKTGKLVLENFDLGSQVGDYLKLQLLVLILLLRYFPVPEDISGLFVFVGSFLTLELSLFLVE
jgi:hypothetical protein